METVKHNCAICGATSMSRFLRMEGAPAHIGVLWRDRPSALDCPKGDIDLCFCTDCGFVYNVAFDTVNMVYEGGYDNALDFSGVFTEYARTLASQLVDRYGLRNRHVIEIGCGNAEFLKLLCEAGDNRGTGFDPSAPADAGAIDDRISFVHDYYSRRYADRSADLVACRHVFEHIEDPKAFLAELHATIGGNATPVFFEVPSLRNIVRGNSPWEIIYEHCAYYGEEALRRAFQGAGFAVDEVAPLFNDLYLGLWARPGEPEPGGPVDLSDLSLLVSRFGSLFDDKVARWRRRIAELRTRGEQAVAWGGGARGTTFLNVLDAGETIRYVVDINPRKHGKFVPGTAQEIVPPERLTDIRPGVIIVMNPVYLEEIRASAATLGLEAEFVVA